MMIGKENFEEIFAALNRQIEVRGGVSIGLVVCRGTALTALGLINRTTKDVDVLGRAEETSGGTKIFKMDEFPPWLKEAARAVARDFGLPEG